MGTVYAGKDEVVNFSYKITYFIETNGIKNEYGNLICDYIEALYLHDYPVLDLDLEKQVYIFYHYVSLYSQILAIHGEEEFIKHIVSIELNKSRKQS